LVSFVGDPFGISCIQTCARPAVSGAKNAMRRPSVEKAGAVAAVDSALSGAGSPPVAATIQTRPPLSACGGRVTKAICFPSPTHAGSLTTRNCEPVIESSRTFPEATSSNTIELRRRSLRDFGTVTRANAMVVPSGDQAALPSYPLGTAS
jgi:hypothetical protein